MIMRMDDAPALRWLGRHGFVLAVLPLLTVISLYCARQRELWTDEYLTLKIARAESLGACWEMLATGPQSDAPLFYLAARASMAAFGDHPAAFRLPSIFGGLLLAVSLYAFAVRRCAPAYARIALLFPLIPPVLSYTIEGRPYGLWLGWSGLSLLCWQLARDGNRVRRRTGVAGLALASAAAVSTHYYAVLVIAALGLAELARAALTRRIDAAVWAALAVGGLPLLAYRPLIANASTFIAGSWAAPSGSSLMYTYVALFAADYGTLFVLLPLVALAALLRPRPDPGAAAFRPDDLAAALALAALPVLGLVLAKAYTNNYAVRYVLPASAGFAVLAAAAAQRVGGARRWPGHLLTGLTLALLLYGYRPYRAPGGAHPHAALTFTPLARAASDLARREGLPLVTDNMHALVCGKSADPDLPLVYVCGAATGCDGILRRTRPWWGGVLEPDELHGRVLLVPGLNEGHKLESLLRRLGGTFAVHEPLPGGQPVYLVDLPDR